MNITFQWLSNNFGIVPVTMWLISFFSSIHERLLLYLICVAAITASILLANRLPRRALVFTIPPLVTFLTFWCLYLMFPVKYTFYVREYLWPGDTLTTDHPAIVALILTTLVALERISLLLRRNGEKRWTRLSTWSVVALIPGLAVLLLNGWSLRGLARVLHPESAVQQFAVGDFNALEIDAKRRRLFACGHGTNYLLAYDLRDLDKAPEKSKVEVGYAWSFAYNSEDNELYVVDSTEQRSVGQEPPQDREIKTLRILDATTLELKTTVRDLHVGYGDAWVTWDRYKGHIIIASEQPGQGTPTIALDRVTREIVYSLPEKTTNVFLSPDRPVLYMNNSYTLWAFDTNIHDVTAKFGPGKVILERMAMLPGKSELFVAASSEASVFRFDSDTLELKGILSTTFGARTLAVDPIRNLLFAGSLLSNKVDVIDIGAQRSIGKYYVGPWLRTILVDSASGIAYVSSKEGLFRVDYVSKLHGGGS